MISDDRLKNLLLSKGYELVEPPVEGEVIEDIDNNSILVDKINKVMESYQNANKWLDIIKEELLMTHGSVFFSNYIHELAHTMPERFDRFGDILHTADIKVPYPATPYIPYDISDPMKIIVAIFQILDSIKYNLQEFIDKAEESGFTSMAIATEELLVDIESERTTLHRMNKAYQVCKYDIIEFDKWVCQYINNLNNFID